MLNASLISAQAFVARLRANVDDWYDDRTTYEAFGELQGQAWREIKAAGKEIDEIVCHALRNRIPTCQISSPGSVL